MNNILAVTLVITTVIFIAGLILFRVVQSRRRNKQIVEHKNALKARLQEDSPQVNFVSVDISVYLEHKTALRERIKHQEWFETFTDLFFSRQSSKVVFEPSLFQKGTDRHLGLFDLLALANDQPILLLGDAGSGKTTCLKRLAVHLSELAGEIPFILDLATYHPGRDLLVMLNTERKLDRGTIEAAIRSGQATILIDAVNETRYQEEALDAVNELITGYKGNRYFLASRTSNYFFISAKVGMFAPFEVQPLRLESISEFLTKYLGEKSMADDLLGNLDEKLLGLCGNPYMLEMVGTVYKDTGEIPANRADLYNKFLYRLLYHWDKKIPHVIFHSYLEDLLAITSYQLDQRTTAHRINEVQEIVAQQIPALNQKFAQSYNSQDVWGDFQKLAIIRLDSRTSTFMFIHQSIQEYYAGLHLYKRIIDNRAYSDIVDYAKDFSWNEPILFLAGLLPDVTELVYTLIDASRHYLAAKCAQACKKIESVAIDDLVVAALTEFKYGDVDELSAVVSYDSILALHTIQEKCSPTLEPRIVKDLDYFVEKYAPIDAYRILFREDQFSTEELIKLIDAGDNTFTPDYIWTLGERFATTAASTLMNYVKNKKNKYRPEAVRALGKVADRKNAVDLLDILSANPNSDLCVPIFNTLIQVHRRLGLDDEKVVSYLVNYLNNNKNLYRDSAGWALKSIAGIRLKEIYLQQALQSDDIRVQGMFIYIIGELKINDLAPMLIKMIAEKPDLAPYVKEDLAVTLGSRLKTPLALETLQVLANDTDAAVRMQAINGLSEINDPSTSEIIRSLLKDDRRFVAKSAQLALNKTSPRKEEKKMEEIVVKLRTLNSRATALQNRISETKQKEKEGFLDTGRADALLLKYETERLELLSEIESALANTPLSPLNSAIDRSRGGSTEEEVKEELKETAERAGWGKAILDKINDYKGEIVGLIIQIGLELAKQFSIPK